METISSLKIGEKGIIEAFDTEKIPLKLQELGCLPGNEVELIQIAPFKDPLHLKMNGSHLSIRKDLAAFITISKIERA
ncbi:MAG: ferrous iron transport protein A [Bacteroidetes bacterium]|nr:ferrous iron transport protein A [Bacteroidota bacterium]